MNKKEMTVKEFAISADKTLPKTAKPRKEAKPKWDKPVSRAFYEKLKLKVAAIYKSLGYMPQWTSEIMEYVDIYLRDGTRPTRQWRCEDQILAIFYCLKHDIDAAIHRSAECRRRAAERRALKSAAKAFAGQSQGELIGGNQSASVEECTNSSTEISSAINSKQKNCPPGVENSLCEGDLRRSDFRAPPQSSHEVFSPSFPAG